MPPNGRWLQRPQARRSGRFRSASRNCRLGFICYTAPSVFPFTALSNISLFARRKYSHLFDGARIVKPPIRGSAIAYLPSLPRLYMAKCNVEFVGSHFEKPRPDPLSDVAGIRFQGVGTVSSRAGVDLTSPLHL